MKKAMIFGLGGGGRRETEIQEVIVDQNSARVCVRLARLFSSFYVFCLNALNAFSVCLCDAIMTLTRSTTGVHSSAESARPRVTTAGLHARTSSRI